MADSFSMLAQSTGINPILLFILTAWSLVWMGLAMWKAARKGNKIWFIVFIIFHTAGILEILYIFIFSQMSGEKTITQIKKPKIKSKKKK